MGRGHSPESLRTFQVCGYGLESGEVRVKITRAVVIEPGVAGRRKLKEGLEKAGLDVSADWLGRVVETVARPKGLR